MVQLAALGIQGATLQVDAWISLRVFLCIFFETICLERREEGYPVQGVSADLFQKPLKG